MADTSHLVALHTRLSHERARLAEACKPGEIALRTVWVAQIEREIAGEYERLGMSPDPVDLDGMTDDELLLGLMA